MVLNSEQRKAIEHKSGPLLIVAGAGTGKTTVVTERIKWFISQGLAKPEEILALTFTEKAAREMEVRVDQALPYGTFGLWISTFHSFCDRILRAEALHIGLNPHYKLLTEAETYLLVKNNFWKFDFAHFRPTGNPYKFIEGMIGHFSRLKDEDVSPQDYSSWAQNQKSKIKNQNLENKDDLEKDQELALAYEVYEKLKTDEGVMDFSDLIFYTLKLFRTRKNILARYQKQFKQILVDEFQDTNFAQNELVKLLASGGNITVVADDDQSIYRFRGAAISNVLQFRKDFLPAGRQVPKLKTITLTQNYRSTQEILDRSYDLIQHNNPDRLEIKEKIDKRLVATPLRQGSAGQGKIEMIYVDRVENEAQAVISKIKGPNYSDYAILVRANNHSEPFVRALERARIPYQFLGPGQLFRQSEIKDLIAYLKVLADFTDSVSLYRVLSMEIFDFSQHDLIGVLNTGKKTNFSLFEAIEKENLPAGRQGKFADFVSMVHRHQEMIPKKTAGQILYHFLEDSGILKSFVDFEENRAKNISKFFDKLKSFESTNKDASVFAVVDYLTLAMDMGESPLAAEIDWSENNAVNILTIHSAKGLEFPIVFLVNLVEGRFPTRERKEQIPIPDNLIKEVLPEGDFHLQEERRLFYVGMTRAKERLIFSAANYYGEGKRERKISPFVHEALGPSFANLPAGKAGAPAGKEKQIPLFEWSKSPDLEPRTYNLEPTKVDYLSYSAIEAFRTCPLHFKLRYLLRIPTPTTAPLSMGNSIHLALKDAYQNKKNLLESLKENWIIEGYTSKKHEQESFEKAKKFLTEYQKSDLHKNANPIHLEESFSLNISSDLKIGGKIDRIDELPDGTIEIIDYKTGANVPTQKEIDSELQMTIYALAATIKKPIDKVKLCFYYFDTTSKIETVRTASQLEEAKKELLEIRSQIESSNFQCSAGLLCQNCEFKMLCNG